MNFNKGARIIIKKITIDSIKKNSKYKIIHYNNRYFIIDINRNKLTYIFTIMNYIIRQQLIEISKEELQKIKIFHVNKEQRKKAFANGRLGVAIGISIGFSAKPFIKYLYFDVKVWWVIFFILLAIIPLLILKGKNDRKNRRKLNINLDNYKAKAFILPNTKELLKVVFLNIIGYLLFIFCTLAPIMDGEFSYITFLFILLIFSFILFQNGLLYTQYKIEGRIGGIKWKQ